MEIDVATFVLNALAGGCLWDRLKQGLSITAENVRDALCPGVASPTLDKVLFRTAAGLTDAPPEALASAETLKAHLENNDLLRGLVEQLAAQPGIVNQYSQTVHNPSNSPSFSGCDMRGAQIHYNGSASPQPAPLPHLLTPLPPASAVFVGRDEEHAALDALLGHGGQRAVVLVNGLGGVGKTGLCRHWVNAKHERYAHVAWIDFQQTLRDSLVMQLGAAFALPPDAPGEDRFDVLMRKLCALDANSLLVVDNAPCGSDAPMRPLRRLPCHVLATSRGGLDGFAPCPLGFLPPEKWRKLFCAYLGRTPGQNEEEALAAILERCAGHTLTLELLAKTAAKAFANLGGLLETLREHGFNLTPFVRAEVGADWSENAAAQFFAHLCKLYDVATLTAEEQRVLHLLSVLPPNLPLPLERLQPLLGLSELTPLTELAAKGWLTRVSEQDTPCLTIHPVVQEVARCHTPPTLEACGGLVKALADAMHCGPETNPIPLAHACTPLAAAVLGHLATEVAEPMARLAHQTAFLLQHLGDRQGARQWQEKAVAIREKALPEDHPDLAMSYSNMSGILQALGDMRGARQWQEKAIAIREKALPKDHPHLAVSYSNMSAILQDLGDRQGARQWQEKDIAICEKVLPKDHPDLATSYNNMSQILQNLGDMQSARQWQEKAIAICEKALPKDHPHLATSYNNMSQILKNLGDRQGARQWQEKAIAIREKALPEDHPDLAASYNNMSQILKDLGDRQGARQWQEKAIAIREKALPEDHPDLAASYNNMSGILQALGDRLGARQWQEKAVAIFEKALPKDHPDLAASYNNMSAILQDLGDRQGARQWQEKAIAIREKALPEDHPDLAASYNNMCTICYALGDRQGARQWQEKAIAICQKALPEDHPHLALAYDNMAALLHAMGHDTEAEAFAAKRQRVLALRTAKYGREGNGSQT